MGVLPYLLWAFIGWVIMILMNFEAYNKSLINYTRKQAYTEYLQKYYIFWVYSILIVIAICNFAYWGILYDVLGWFGYKIEADPEPNTLKAICFFLGLFIQLLVNFIRQVKFPVLSHQEPEPKP